MYLVFERQPGAPAERAGWDATLSETPEFVSRATQFPVEAGAEITDFILHEPQRLAAEVFVSNSPLDPEQLGEDRVRKLLDLLHELREKKILVRAVTPHRVFESMAVVSIAPPRSAATGDSLSITLQLQEVRKVESKTAKVAPLVSEKGGKAAGAKDQAQPKQDRGNQTATEPAAASPKRSWGAQLADGFRGM